VLAPEQIVELAGVAVAKGTGLTVIITGTEGPEHPLAVGTILYVTVPAEAPEVSNVCPIEVPLPALPPVAPDCDGATHANVVPGIVPVSVIAVVDPEQIV
jgi:hypothetical protein